MAVEMLIKMEQTVLEEAAAEAPTNQVEGLAMVVPVYLSLL